jgi:subtilisin family serine protease
MNLVPLVLALTLPPHPASIAPPAATSPPAVQSRPPSYAPGEVLVVLDGDLDANPAAEAAVRARDPGLAQLLERHGLTRSRPIGPRASVRGARVLRLFSDRPDFDPVAAAQQLRASGRFRAATPNYRLKLCITIPNDPLVLPEQWYIHATNDADNDLPEGWDIERGDTSVVIGIADTGVDLGHPDLMGQIWRNWGEIPGNSVDDDGNGWVDDVNGWDFGDDDNDPNPHPVFDPDLGIDIAFHGTFAAGIAAAATNNGIGIAGAGWNSRILPLKVVNSAGDITSDALAGAFLYATEMQADVLNLSLGQYGEPGLPEFFQQLVDAADSARVVCVAAAGNDADSARFYPAANRKVIAVGATDESGFRASFSNWGPWIDVAAPGSAMWSCLNQNYTFDDISIIFYSVLFCWDEVEPYICEQYGTSFACPLVAGTVALVRAHWPPGLWPQPMEAHMVQTGDVVAYDLPIGVKMNALRALTELAGVSAPGPAIVARLLPGRPNPFRDRVTLGFSLATESAVGLRVHDVQGRVVRALAGGRFGPGTHRVEWDGRDANGRSVESGVYFVRLDAGGSSIVRRVARMR